MLRVGMCLDPVSFTTRARARTPHAGTRHAACGGADETDMTAIAALLHGCRQVLPGVHLQHGVVPAPLGAEPRARPALRGPLGDDAAASDAPNRLPPLLLSFSSIKCVRACVCARVCVCVCVCAYARARVCVCHDGVCLVVPAPTAGRGAHGLLVTWALSVGSAPTRTLARMRPDTPRARLCAGIACALLQAVPAALEPAVPLHGVLRLGGPLRRRAPNNGRPLGVPARAPPPLGRVPEQVLQRHGACLCPLQLQVTSRPCRARARLPFCTPRPDLQQLHKAHTHTHTHTCWCLCAAQGPGMCYKLNV